MAVVVIDTIKPKNNGTFPVVEAEDVKVTNSKRLDAALSEKANQSDVSALQTAVAGKASQSDLNALSTTVAGKQNALTTEQLAAANSGITSELVTQISTNTTAIEGKASQSDLDTTNAAVAAKANASDVATETASLQAQIDAIVTPVTQDAEVENARVGADGTSYQTLKARLDAENNNVNQSIDYISSDVETEINDKIGSDKYTSETIDLTAGVTTTGGVNGAIGSTINVTSSASYKHKKIDVAYGDYFEITIPQLASATYPYYIIATDVNDVIVRRWGAVPAVASVNSYTLYISDSSIKYLYIMFKAGETTQSAVRKIYTSVQSQIDDIVATDTDNSVIINDKLGNVKYNSESIDVSAGATTEGAVKGNVGSAITVVSTQNYKYKKISVASGEIYAITIPQTTSENYPYYIIGTDTNDIIVKEWGEVPAEAGTNTFTVNISDSSIKYLYVMMKSGETSQSVEKKTYISLQSQITSISDPTSDTLKEQLLEDKMYTVIELNQERRCFNFAFITDTHANGYENTTVRASENIDLLKRVCNLGMLDCGVHGGDIISAYDTTDADYIKALCKYIQSYKNFDIPFYFAKGNHEVNAEEGYVAGVAIEIPQYYVMVQNRLKNKNVVTNPEAPYDGYYYVDFDDVKIRLIVANVFRRADNGTTMNVGSKEEAWLYTKALDFTAKDDPTAWNVIVVSHFHFTDTANFTKILQAFNDKGTQYGDYVFNESNGGSIIAHIHGHSHIDEYSNAWGYNQIGVKKGFANVVSWGTTNEFCFDVFSVDLDNNKLYETRFGSGSSREYSWGAESNIRTD